MTDRQQGQGRSSPPPGQKNLLKFRQSKTHNHHHNHHHHHHHGHGHGHGSSDQIVTQSSSAAQAPLRPQQVGLGGTDIALRLDSPHGSNELYINVSSDEGGGSGGRLGHTSVAIYQSSSSDTLSPRPNLPANYFFPAFPLHPDPPLRRNTTKPRPAEDDTISQTGNPYDVDKDDVYRAIRNEYKRHNDNNDVDTQEVAVDTQDLDRIMFTTPFLLNFRHYDELEIFLHVGLRKRNKLPFLNPSTFVPPSTDDYNREVFRYLKTQPRLEALKLILEICPDDDNLTYKTFDEDGGGNGHEITISDNNFPVIRSNLGSYWRNTDIPTGLNFFHVELPGLSSFYLNDWKRFMELQTGLQTLICNFGAVLWNFYENTVRNNEATLEKVVLRRVISYDVKHQRHVPLNFAIFENCIRLSYLKITGGGYKERWGDWVNFAMTQSRQELPQQELLLHVNFEYIPIENLTEFHFAKISINHKRLQELCIACRGKKLELICADCPDKEYYGGDWEIFCENGHQLLEQPSNNPDVAVMFGGVASKKKHAEYYANRQQQKTYLIIFLLILTIIAFVAMTVAVGVAISYSNEGREERT